MYTDNQDVVGNLRMHKMQTTILNHYITHKGKTVSVGQPRKYTFFYKKLNLSITSNKKYMPYSNEPLLHLFSDDDFGHYSTISCLTQDEDITLIHDYILGDHIRYTEPQPRQLIVETTGCCIPFRIFRISPSYKRIHVMDNFHLE